MPTFLLRNFLRLFQRKSKFLIIPIIFITILLYLFFSLPNISSSSSSPSSSYNYNNIINPQHWIESFDSTISSDLPVLNDLPKSSELPEPNDLSDLNLKQFYSSLMETLIELSPEGECGKNYNSNCKLEGALGGDPSGDDYKNWFKATYDNLSECLMLTDYQITMLRNKHSMVTDFINQITLPNNAIGGKGIVIVGGGKYSLLAAMNIEVLRYFNTTLPVEIFIPPGENDPSFCQNYLPKLNAKCTQVEDIFNEATIQNVHFKGYQYKSLALLSSKFKDILFLDADNFPIKNLDSIFDDIAYKANGMILWPDFWRRTDSPRYYDIAKIKYNRDKRVRNLIDDLTPVEVYTENLNDMKNVPFHDLEGTIPDLSTESGQFLINKSIHWKTIALSLYYNLNGPNWYYPIFTQGGPGEGDKETFISAATVFELPYYQTRRKPAIGGYHHDGFHGVCMLQEDFRIDFQNYLMARKELNDKYKNFETHTFTNQSHNVLKHFYETYFTYDEPDVMFVHFNFPKLDPVELSKDHRFILKNGEQLRSISDLKPLRYFDLELNVNQKLKEVVCDMDNRFVYILKSFENPETTKETVCNYIEKRIKFLSETHFEATTSK
ncbi:alpha-mannosyltransferase PWA37_002768 [Arxiozyma heterogenica]|uniref:Alpha-1,2-mannosyltransferase n=1 Tax=Arxiozyma heterogenica TaxID=278026 RepID=A0AAN7ZSD5_9SACH|nr:hypothetical protein RI543_003486 [Kazachstania heterogenica]